MDVISKIRSVTQKFHQNKFDSVIKECKKIIDIDPGNIFILNLCGLALQNTGNFLKSIDYFEKVINLDSRHLPAINNLANSYKNLEEMDLAEKLYLRVLKIDALHFETNFNYGNLKFELNQLKEAIELFDIALKINPKNTRVYMSLAIAHRSIGNFEKSKDFCNKAIALNPHLIDGHKLLSTLIDYKKDKKHLKEMNKIIYDMAENKKKPIGLFFATGKAYEDIGDYENSFKNLKIGNEIKSKNINYNINNDIKVFRNIIKTFQSIDFKKIDKKNQNKKMIFICGMPRSGTTLVEQIISAHDNVGAGGELTYLHNIVNETFFNDNKIIKSTLDKEIYSKENIIYEKYFNKLKIKKFNSKFITDKNPLNFFWIGFIKIFFPGSKIIYCNRNPKDLTFSLYKNVFGSPNMNWTYDENNISSYYNNHLDLMNFWNEKIPNYIYKANNEKIIDNPENEVKNLIKFLELPWDKKCLTPNKFNKSAIKTITNVNARNPINNLSVNSSANYEKYLSRMYSLLN